ncbi:hypothetical protein LINPERHAP1_LOCUS7550 [Linum perenne]
MEMTATNPTVLMAGGAQLFTHQL